MKTAISRSQEILSFTPRANKNAHDDPAENSEKSLQFRVCSRLAVNLADENRASVVQALQDWARHQND